MILITFLKLEYYELDKNGLEKNFRYQLFMKVIESYLLYNKKTITLKRNGFNKYIYFLSLFNN